MNSNKLSTNILIIFCFFIFLAAILIHKVIANNGFIPDWDEANHLLMSYYYNKTFISYGFKQVFELFANSNTIYPPLYHILTALTFTFIKNWPLSGILVNVPFILVLMLAIYGLGTKVADKKAGLIAALLIPIIPGFLTIQEKSAIDYISISVFIFSFYLLFKTENFSNRKYSVLFGLSICMGLFIKWPFVIPGIPFIFYAINSFIKSKTNKSIVINNVVLALAISLTAIPWYLFNFSHIVNELDFFWRTDSFAQHLWANPTGLSLKNLLLYSYTWPTSGSGVGIIILLFFYIGIFFNKLTTDQKYLSCSILITYIVLTALNDKSAFYVIYTYPLILLLVLSFIIKVKNSIIKNILFAVLIFFTAGNFILTLFNSSLNSPTFLNIQHFNLSLFPNYDTKFTYENWPTEKISELIISSKSCDTDVLVFPDNRYLNVANINYFLASKGSELHSIPAYNFYNPSKDNEFDTNILSSYSCIITKTGDSGAFVNLNAQKFSDKYLLSNVNYDPYSFSGPDDSVINLYIKRRSNK